MNPIKVYTVDEQGYVVQEHILEEKISGVLYLPIIPDAITVPLPATSGTQKPKWNGSSWELEGESQEQINQKLEEQERLKQEELQKQKELEEQERLRREELQRQEEERQRQKAEQQRQEAETQRQKEELQRLEDEKNKILEELQQIDQQLNT